MNRYLKNALSLVLIIGIFLFFGCGKTSNKNTINQEKSQHYELTEKNNNNNESNNNLDNKENVNKSKNENVEKQVIKKKELNQNKNDIKKKEDVKKKEGIKEEQSKKQDIKANLNKTTKSNIKVKNENNFTLILSKNLKGYTGKSSQILFKKKIKICGDKNAMTYLRENSQVIDKGGFLYEINGIHNLYPIPKSKKTEEQKRLKILGLDWFIYLNNKKSPVGLNDIYPKNGDELLLDFHEWDKRELSDRNY